MNYKIITDNGINNAADAIYTAINKWLDNLIAAGKIKKDDGDRISRGDIATLNGAVLDAVKANSNDVETNTYPPLKTEYFIRGSQSYSLWVRVYVEGFEATATEIRIEGLLTYAEASARAAARNAERAQ